MASPPLGHNSGGIFPHGHPVLAAMWLAALPHDGGEGRAQQGGGPILSMGSQSEFSQLVSKSSFRAGQKVPNESEFLPKQNWKIEGQLLQQEFKAKAAVQQATKRERGSPQRKHKGKAKRNRQGKSGTQRDGGHGIQGIPQPGNGKRSLDEITQMAKDAGWVASARRRLKTRLYSRATLATKDSKRRRIHEIMESCCIEIGNDGLNQEDLLTIAAVLGEAGLKSADQYLGEVKLLQLEAGISWPDVMERQMTMVKRALRRDVGPDCRAKEFNPENIRDDIWEMKTTKKGSPVRIAWSYSWATIWMLRCVELAQLRARDIDLDFKKKRVSLYIRKSKTDQSAQGIRRTLKCCGRQSCERLCPWDLAIRILSDHVNQGETTPPLFPDHQGSAIPKVKVVKSWMDQIDGELTGHSGRRSGAMWYARRGLPIHEIGTLGRWRSSAVFRYIEEALQDIPLNANVNQGDLWDVRPIQLKEDRRDEGEPEVKFQEREAEPKETREVGKARIKPVKPPGPEECWAVSTGRSGKVSHRVRKASWNLNLAQWDTWCGWHFAERNVKVVLTPKFQATTKKCKKCESAYQLSCLPDSWGSKVFVGEVNVKKGDAEQSVAAVALAAIRQDVSLMSKFAAPPKQKVRPPMGMKGKGGGKGKVPPGAPNANLLQLQASAFMAPQLQVLGLGIPQTGFW
eukprot:s46_g13.t1